ncbi:MAG: gluconokinase [Cypionkella sp.]|nr:gluconokinase [Cypionkella sp.]
MPYSHSFTDQPKRGAKGDRHRIVIMGVSGSGKTTVGQALAQELGILFRDGDALHNAANVAKMRAGHPLNDEDRWGWLELVANSLRRDAPVVIACSALRGVYRNHIRAGAGGDVDFIHLSGQPEVIAARLATRQHDYMPTHLLDSQFKTLEPPPLHEALHVPITLPVSSQVKMITNALAAR